MGLHGAEDTLEKTRRHSNERMVDWGSSDPDRRGYLWILIVHRRRVEDLHNLDNGLFTAL